MDYGIDSPWLFSYSDRLPGRHGSCNVPHSNSIGNGTSTVSVHTGKEKHMGKILVIYHSQQRGNTKEVAEALADGARTAGADVVLINTNECRVTLDDVLGADAVAIGSPDYYGYVAGTIKTFFDDMYIWDKAGKAVTGKPAAFFYSHGGGGTVKQSLEKFGSRFFKQVGETVERKPSDAGEAAEKGRALGRELAQNIG
jgi:multimeric flavodoxin WrbA